MSDFRREAHSCLIFSLQVFGSATNLHSSKLQSDYKLFIVFIGGLHETLILFVVNSGRSFNELIRSLGNPPIFSGIQK